MTAGWERDAEEQLRAHARELRRELAERDREIRRLRKEVKALAEELRGLRAGFGKEVTPIRTRRPA